MSDGPTPPDALTELRLGLHRHGYRPVPVAGAHLDLKGAGTRFPSIPRDPDRGTALRALGYLKDLISTFPFVTAADRAVALSGILTALIRRSLPTAPLHAFNAPTAGSGKSLLVDIASSISTARPAPVIAQGKSEEEMEKRLIKSSRIEQKAPVPSKATIRKLIDAAGEDFQPHLIVSALGGLRASELRGLRWLDVDFDAGFLRVRQRADAYNQIGEPKSRAGFRDIPVGPMVLNALRRWKLRCPKSELGLVFPAPKGGILQHTNTQKRFRKLCESAGVKMRWHDLRHFAVSLWIEQGFSIKEVMTFAGHASVQMTMERYGHLFPSPDHQKGMALVEQRVFG